MVVARCMGSRRLMPVPFLQKHKEQLWLLGPYLAIIAISIGFSLLIPRNHEAPEQITQTQPNQATAQQEPAWDYAVFWEAVATCIIALLAVGSLYDSRQTSKRELRAYVSAVPSRAALMADDTTM